MSKIVDLYRNELNPMYSVRVSSEMSEPQSHKKEPPQVKTDNDTKTKDSLSLSPEMIKLRENTSNRTAKAEKTHETESAEIENEKESETPGTKKLSEGEQKLVEELKKIDREVRAHEAAHKSAGGGLVRGVTSFSYTVGPDGQQYAVAGEVKIDMSYDLDNPEEAVRKMGQIRRAALAPSDPSSQDRSVATKAASIESRARAEIQKDRAESGAASNVTDSYLAKIYKNSIRTLEENIGSLMNKTDKSNYSEDLKSEKRNSLNAELKY